MKKLLTPLFSLVFTLTCLACFSQAQENFYFEQISTKEGLSQNTVRAIIEDENGFLWAGTLDGLNRYDGYRIVTYKPELGNPASLIDHRIKRMYLDRDGLLWVRTYRNEFSCYDPVSDSFTNITDPYETRYFTGYHEANNGDIWFFGNTNGCLRIRKTEFGLDQYKYPTEPGGGSGRPCKFLLEDSASDIWTGGDEGLISLKSDGSVVYHYKGIHNFTSGTEQNGRLYFTTTRAVVVVYDIGKGEFSELSIPGTDYQITDVCRFDDRQLLVMARPSGLWLLDTETGGFEVPAWAAANGMTGFFDVIADRNQGLWLYDRTGEMWYFNPERSRIRRMTLIPSDVVAVIDSERYNIFIDSRELIWITTYGNGIFCYDPRTDALRNFTNKQDNYSPASDYLLSITEDRFGNIWVGSEYAGIIKIYSPNLRIETVRPEPLDHLGRNNNIRTVFEDRLGNFWVGTKNGGLYLYDSTLSRARLIRKDINAYSITCDARDRVWIGTKGDGVLVFDLHTLKEMSHYTAGNNPGDLSHKEVFHICIDNEQRVWVGTFGGGVVLLEETSGGVTSRKFFGNTGSSSYIRYIYQDRDGLMWACTCGGLIQFDPHLLIEDDTAFTHMQMELVNKRGINSNDIKTIFHDSHGIRWIGTAGGGLNRIDEAGGNARVIYYTAKEGLSGDFITGIVEDPEGNLWMSSESGITRLDRKTNSFTGFKASDNAYGNHINENSNVFSSGGKIIFGSLDGLLVIDPDSFVPDSSIPIVTLTDFFIFDQKVKASEVGSPLETSITYCDRVVLKHDQNTFSIEFSSLELKDPDENKFIHILENFDSDWSAASNQSYARYKNIPPGKYTFMVKSSNTSGLWNDYATTLEIVVRPPFWRSPFAYCIYSLLALVLLHIAYRTVRKINTLNNDIRVGKEVTNLKLRFFTNISHEFRTPLTLIRGAVESLAGSGPERDNYKKQLGVLQKSSDNLTRLIDQLLEFRKIQNNVLRLDLQKTDIVDFCRQIFSSFEEKAAAKGIGYKFDSNIEQFVCYIDRRKIDKIVYNLLTNAFKFTPRDGLIEFVLRVDNTARTFTISVKDNGKGIEKEKQQLLFSRFMQANFSYSGTGVGLSLVKEFVEVHKGKVWYEANGRQGSIFAFEIPTDEVVYKGENFVQEETVRIESEPLQDMTADNEDFEEVVMPDTGNLSLEDYRILVIDDNDDIRGYLMDIFGEYVKVDGAENGREGLQKAIDINPDLIICDVMMPEMDGFEVTAKLREEFQTCHIPIILLTAHTSFEHQVEGICRGADAYITKPFSRRYLVSRVFKMIEQRELLKKRFSNEFVFDGDLITGTEKDKKFYDRIMAILDKNIADPELSVEKFAELTKMSRTTFYRKVKGITGISPNELIRISRLKIAAGLILEGNLTVSEIAYKVGFDDPFYFSKCFKAQYKCSPSRYGKEATGTKESEED